MAPSPFLDKSALPYLRRTAIGGTNSIKTDETLRVKNGLLGVDVTDQITEGDLRPVTSNAVAVTVGNIEALMETI